MAGIDTVNVEKQNDTAFGLLTQVAELDGLIQVLEFTFIYI